MTDTTEAQAIAALAKDSWNLIGIKDTFGIPGHVKPNTPLTISYSFFTARPTYYIGDYGDSWLKKDKGVADLNSFDTLSGKDETEGQKKVFSESMKAWSSVANIKFITPSVGQIGDIVIGNVGLGDTSSGVTTPPTELNTIAPGGDIFISSDDSRNASIAPGQFGYLTILHELGHALGLDHPVQDNPPNRYDTPPFLPEGNGDGDTRYTVMVNYRLAAKGIDGTDKLGWLPSKPMLYDIAAIQYLYGVNPTTGNGGINPDTGLEDGTVDNTYRFKEGADAVQAIWDAGGNDTIDASDNKSKDERVTIDLRPGHFSYVGNSETTSKSQIAIAFQPIGADNQVLADYKDNYIENAIGGSGDDTLRGNDGVNRLEGGAGKNTYYVGNGDTILDSGTVDKGTDNVKGEVFFNDKLLKGGTKSGENEWIAMDIFINEKAINL